MVEPTKESDEVSTNFFDDSQSMASKQSKREKKDKKDKKVMKQEAEEVADKKKLKVMKQALLELRKEKDDLSEQVTSLSERCRELEKDNSDTNNKYMRLYEENDQLQEQLQKHQYTLTSKKDVSHVIKSHTLL